jgi:hypothetical protein
MKLELAIITAALVSTLLPACAQEKSLDEIDKRSNRLMFAEGLSKESFDRIVISGTKTQIGFFHSLNPDCTSSGDRPHHDTARTRHRRGHDNKLVCHIQEGQHSRQVQRT